MDFSPQQTQAVLEQWILATGMPLTLDLRNSKGAYLRDASGKDYLDFFTFFASRPLAFNHPGLSTLEFQEEVTAVARHKPSNCDIYTPEYAAFAKIFGEVALGGHFKHLFFIEGGSPAVENALKAAIDWKHHKNIAAGKGEKGSQIIHFKRAFHGRTGYCLSITDPFDDRKVKFFPKFPWPRVTNPWHQHPFDDAAKAAVEELEAQSLKEIDEAFEKNPDDIAAIIIEPIQGEGGDNYFRSEFLQALRKVADERDALLIFDEIQTGFGSTGTWWDWQHHGVQPDLMTFGKKTQICGFAATGRMDDVDNVFSVPSRISSTFEGNIVDMVRCRRVIEIIQQEDLITNAKTMGSYMVKLLNGLAENHPEMRAVRGRGTWAAFDLANTEERDNVVRGCFEEELLVLPCGQHSLRLRAPLDVDADAIGRCAAQLEAGIRRAYGK